MKHIIQIYKLLFIASVFLISSCSDFLDTEQMGVTTLDGFYSTDDEVLEGLYGIYDKVQSENVSSFQFKLVLSDDALAGGGGRGDNSNGEELDEFTFDASNNIIETMFTKYYQIVYTANLLISNVTEPDTDIKKVAVAEAKALRAYAYFELVTLWGTPPLVTEPLNSDEYSQPNSTEAELWAQIEKDLSEAIAVLPVKSASADASRVSKGTAQAWLGKAYLYQEKYDEAIDQFEDVIESNEYSLNPDFSTITRASSEFGVESLFEISYISDLSAIGESTWIIAYCGPRTPYFSAGTSGISETAWGWVEPRQGLYDAYVAAGDEVRRKATLMSEDELINEYGGSFRVEGNLPYGSYGLVRLKHGAWVAETPGEVYHTVGGLNYRITRYADVLLMAAEAYNRASSPNDNKALEYVNLVRERAQLADLTSTGDDLFDDIKTERRLELAFEFTRYQDLIRWGDAATVLADQGKEIPRGDGTYYSFADAGFKERNWVLPFPDTEISVNQNIVQNTGY